MSDSRRVLCTGSDWVADIGETGCPFSDGVGGRAELGTGRWGGGSDVRCEDFGLPEANIGLLLVMFGYEYCVLEVLEVWTDIAEARFAENGRACSSDTRLCPDPIDDERLNEASSDAYG